MTAMEDYSALIQRIVETVEETAVARSARPTATYRLQFAPETMTFASAAALVPYLDALGASHLYSSPCLKSRSGGASGYSVVDYSQLNPALGEPQEFHHLADELRRRGMGQILDIVPNHMSAAADENRWWRDVLENGPSSPYAPYFDIDWSPVNEALQGKVLLPMLGDQYGKVLDAGQLKLVYREGSFFIQYYDMQLPLNPRTYRQILSLNLEALQASMPSDSEELLELESIITALEHLPNRNETSPASIVERQREKEIVKRRLDKLVGNSPAIAEHLARNVEQMDGRSDDPHSFDLLDALLDAQIYRLSHWKAAADEINYRRFFDINELAAICMEEPRVFEESHQLVFDLLVRGDIDGLRIDHIDGLYDPHEYLSRLQLEYLRSLGRGIYRQILDSHLRAEAEAESDETARVTAEATVGFRNAAESPPASPSTTVAILDRESLVPSPPMPDWKDIEASFMRSICKRFNLEMPPFDPYYLPLADTVEIVVAGTLESEKERRTPLYVVVEKILGPEEPIPKTWTAAGTTGYDFANLVGGLFVDPSGYVDLQKIYHRFTDEEMIFREVAYQSKSLILRVAMSSDLQLLAHRLNRLSERHRHYRDFTLNELRTALREIISCFPVYRTYIRQGIVAEQDRQFIARAAASAKRRNPARNPAIFDFIRDVLLLEAPPELDETGRRERALFVGRFQQATSPVTAKGIEDTAFYRHFPLVSLNEVGGDPTRGTTLVEEFHRQNMQRHAEYPLSLLASSTHDTKRSEDVRARINVLSEMPATWRTVLNRWSRLNARHRREVDGHAAPSRNDEYLFYQNLVGFWPLDPPDAKTLQTLAERMQQYMEKATHEAKTHTSWINPSAEYDSAVRDFIAAALKNHPKNRFLTEFCAFHEQIVNPGLWNALAQLVLKLTAPGVPDLYQGQELWDFSLVDPDNRRPVDFTVRQNLLKRLEEAVGHDEESLMPLARELAVHPHDPRLKLFVTWRMLQFRRHHADLFLRGEYIPLTVEGPAAKHLCAFARRWSSINGNENREQIAIVAVPRWIAQLLKSAPDLPPNSPPLEKAIWRDTRVNLKGLAGYSLINLFTGQVCPKQNSHLLAADIFSAFPVAVLVNAE